MCTAIVTDYRCNNQTYVYIAINFYPQILIMYQNISISNTYANGLNFIIDCVLECLLGHA